MKKASAFLIVIVLIMSVVVISFFGKSIAVGQYQTYFSDIWFTNEKDANNTIYIEFDEAQGYGTVFLEYEYLPADVDYPDKVAFSLSNDTYTDENGETQYKAEFVRPGYLVFNMTGAVHAYIRTTDGSTKSDDVTVVCY
ncbi:MAG: hypothetical protein LUD29_05350 [Clostridia bacterium]|nr:hypothetical protein [Clostridia bacterium]